MPDTTRPQDVDPDKPVVDADQERQPTPQNRTDGSDGDLSRGATDAPEEGESTAT